MAITLEFDYDYAQEMVELGMGEIRTKDGHKVTVEDWFNGTSFPISGFIHTGKKECIFETWQLDGKSNRIGVQSLRDLILVVRC